MKDKKKDEMKKAVALSYKSGDGAPTVVASGKGFVAEKIVEAAQSGDVTIYKDTALVEELSKIQVGDEIPPDLYEVVAQVLIFIGDLDKLEGYKQNAKSK